MLVPLSLAGPPLGSPLGLSIYPAVFPAWSLGQGLTLGFSPLVSALLGVAFLGVSVILILTVLIQRPQGGGLSGAFGAGGSGETAFGARTGDALTIATIAFFVIWLVVAVALVFATRPPDPRLAVPALTTPDAEPAPATDSPATGTPATGTPATGTPATDVPPAGSTPEPGQAPEAASPLPDAPAADAPALPPAEAAPPEASSDATDSEADADASPPG